MDATPLANLVRRPAHRAPALRLRGAGLLVACSIGLLVPRASSAFVVTATAAQAPRTVLPGERDVALFDLLLSNSGPLSDSLRSLTFTNLTSGSGGQVELDLESGTLQLWKDDGDGTFEPGQDSLAATVQATNGQVRFTGLQIPVPGLGEIRLFLATDLSLLGHDGDRIDVSVQAAADIQMAMAVTVNGSFPLSPAGDFPIDGMSAAELALHPLLAAPIPAGTNDNLVLDVTIPANGYQADVLDRLEVVNLGTAQATTDITSLRLRRDDGDGVFDPNRDAILGSLGSTGGGHWLLTGLHEAVPIGGMRLYVSADLSPFPTTGRTIRLALPTFGVSMTSANDGPNDQMVGQPNDLTITTADRVTLSALPLPPQTVRPGVAGAPLLHLVARNEYGDGRTISRIRVTDVTRGSGLTAELDREFERLALRLDGNDDGALGSLAEDPEVGVAQFSAGHADFTGIAWVLQAGASRHAFVVADASPVLAADGDSLSVLVANSFDVAFTQSTRAAAMWPLDSGARLAIDGLVASQVGIGAVASRTLGPGEGPALALDLTVPRNGYLPDTLQTLKVVDLGTAGPSDIAELRLWRDGGDGEFQAGGDDRDLGPLSPNGATWDSGPLNEAIGQGGARFWVAATVGPSPQDSVTIRLGVPVNGITMTSGNDGPLDGSLGGGATLLISNAPLLATLSIEPTESVVGQSVTARLIVRNRSAEAVTGIAPGALTLTGPGVLSPTSGPLPPAFDLAPAALDTFEWRLAASAPGSLRLSAGASGTGATSGQPRNSLAAVSNPHVIAAPAQELDLSVTQSMPIAVNRGQPDVAPLSLRFSHPGSPGTAPIRIERIRFRLEDADGTGIVPRTLLSRVAVESGSTVWVERDTLESGGATVSLDLPSSALVSAGQSQTLVVRLDVASGTTQPNFRIELEDSTAVVASEAPTGRSLPVQPQGSTYPFRTGPARIVAPATSLNLSAAVTSETRAGRGQLNVPLLSLTLQNPGIDGVTSDVHLAAFAVRLSDMAGVTWPRLSDVLLRVRAATATQILASRTIYPTDDSTMTLALSPALGVPVNTPVALELRADLAPGAPLMRFKATVADPATVDARDVNTGEPVAVHLVSTPLQGSALRIEAVAESLRVSVTPLFAPRTRIGDTGVHALAATLRHPGNAGVGRIRLDSLTVLCRDNQHRDVVPGTVLSRLAVRQNGIEVGSVTTLPRSGGRVNLGLSGVVLEASDTAQLVLEADIAVGAPEGSLELSIAGSGLYAADANLGSGVGVFAEAGAELPLVSGLTKLDPPARELRASLEDRMPATLAADGRSVLAGSLHLRNTAPIGSDSILVDRLVLRAATRDLQSIPIGAAAAQVDAFVAGTPWASGAALGPDSTTAILAGNSPLAVPPGASVAVDLSLRTRSNPSVAELCIGIDSVGVQVRQQPGALLQIEVRPEPGRAFPQWTQAGSFRPMGLASSLSNFPNPFAAGRQTTRFAYFLRSNAQVSLRVVTLGGDLVRVSLDHSARAAGMHEEDGWDGRNGTGAVVRNGVYLAELVAEFEDGRRERVLRKVAVAR